MLIGKVCPPIHKVYSNAFSFKVSERFSPSSEIEGVYIKIPYNGEMVSMLIRGCVLKYHEDVYCKMETVLIIYHEYLTKHFGPIDLVQFLPLEKKHNPKIKAYLWADKYGNVFIEVIPKVQNDFEDVLERMDMHDSWENYASKRR